MASKTMNRPKTAAVKKASQPAVNGTVHGKSEETIRMLAYLKWEAAGKPLDDGLHYWLEAERELCLIPVS